MENNRRIKKGWENSMIFSFQKESEQVFFSVGKNRVVPTASLSGLLAKSPLKL